MNLESRHLVARDNGLELAPASLKAGARICDFCSIQAVCTLDREIQSRSWCGEFTPALSFVPPLLGLEGAFSTFRASSIWYDRARVIYRTHKTVGLYDAKTKEQIGLARLTNAFRGPFSELMEKHAVSNHLCQAKGVTDPLEARVWLPKQIRNLAGSRYVKRQDQPCTVIYLERL